MATTFKNISSNDVVSQRSLLHEAVPITGSIVSGTYNNAADGAEYNIKNYSHGMFQSVYDYPYLSSSANHIFDVTTGYAAGSSLSGTSNVTQQDKKINLYTEMAQVLNGFDYTGSVQLFDEDGNRADGGTKLKECFFLNFSRLLMKDELKKGSFTLELGVSGTYTYTNTFNERVYLKDTNAQNDFKVNTPTGEYGILYATNALGSALVNTQQGGAGASTAVKAGLLFYQTGIAVITGSIFGSLLSGASEGTPLRFNNVDDTVSMAMTGSSISGACDGFRHRIYDMSFNNTTELNSTMYFCRANNNEFNYSSNTTYLSASRLRVKNNSADLPVSFITTVGLYSANNELLAVAKLSEPLQKDPTQEFVLKVRLDY